MLSDIELLKKIKENDLQAEEELFARYKSIVTSIARKYYLIGGDKEDLLQEGWLGFFDGDITEPIRFESHMQYCLLKEK